MYIYIYYTYLYMLGLHNVDLLHYEPCAHSAARLKMISPHSLLWPGVTAPVVSKSWAS